MSPRPTTAAILESYDQGCSAGQSAVTAEAAGQPGAALPLYEQALSLIAQSIQWAHQSALLVPAHVHYALGFYRYCAGRVYGTHGWMRQAREQLVAAMHAVNQALAIEPSRHEHHTLAGMVLAAQGLPAAAESAFQAALQLNSMDPIARWMLAFLETLQGRPVSAAPSTSPLALCVPEEAAETVKFLASVKASTSWWPNDMAPFQAMSLELMRMEGFSEIHVQLQQRRLGWTVDETP